MRRGDVYLADLNPVKGSEQAGRRPVLIFQDDLLIAATLTVLVIPFTTNLAMRKLPTCVFVPAAEAGLRFDHRYDACGSSGFMGLASAYRKAGFVEVARPNERRAIMRYYLGSATE